MTRFALCLRSLLAPEAQHIAKEQRILVYNCFCLVSTARLEQITTEANADILVLVQHAIANAQHIAKELERLLRTDSAVLERLSTLPSQEQLSKAELQCTNLKLEQLEERQCLRVELLQIIEAREIISQERSAEEEFSRMATELECFRISLPPRAFCGRLLSCQHHSSAPLAHGSVPSLLSSCFSALAAVVPSPSACFPRFLFIFFCTRAGALRSRLVPLMAVPAVITMRQAGVLV